MSANESIGGVETKNKLSTTKVSAASTDTKPKAKSPSKDVTKTMGTSDQNECKKAVPDVKIFGEDLFKLLSKASSQSEGWMKSTKAYDTGRGCVIQVTTQQRNPDESYAVAEALTFVPNVRIVNENDPSTRKLVGVR